jgi:hypothetical protein
MLRTVRYWACSKIRLLLADYTGASFPRNVDFVKNSALLVVFKRLLRAFGPTKTEVV